MDLNNLRSLITQNENDANGRLVVFQQAEEQCFAALHEIKTKRDLTEWLNLFYFGMVDPWSRIRNTALKSAVQLIKHTEEKLGLFSGYLRSSSTEDTNNGKNVESQHCRMSDDDLYTFFSCLPERYLQSATWYEKEGVLNFLSRTFSWWAGETELSHSICKNLAYSALSVPELPVREAGATLLTSFTQSDQKAFISIKKMVFDHLALTQTSSAANDIHSLEGHLIALEKMLSQNSEKRLTEEELSLLFKLGSHPAASIRLYVSEVLRPPSELFFAAIVQEICKFENVEGLDSAWAYYETIMIIFNRHLLFHIEHHEGVFPRLICENRSSDSTGHNSFLLIVQSLIRGISAGVFEMKRIASQTLPNFIQFYVRQVESISDFCQVNQSIQNLSAKDSKDGVRDLFNQHGLPCMWWYMALWMAHRSIPLNELEKDALTSNISPPLYDESLKETPAHIYAALLIMSTYFGKCQIAPTIKATLKKKMWKILLRSDARSFIFVGIDFVLMLHQRRLSARSLIPVWVRALPKLLSHEQCIVISMIIYTLYPNTEKHLFSFIYDFSFKAPTLIDGGEDLTLGYSWLRFRYPNRESLPFVDSFPFWKRKRPQPSEGHTTLSTPPLHKLFRNLYTSVGTDPTVLRKIQLLMILLLKDDEARDVWIDCILEAIFHRLNTVTPKWRSATKADSTSEESDWDVEEYDDICTASGIVEEKGRAAEVCKIISSVVLSYPSEFKDDMILLLSSS